MASAGLQKALLYKIMQRLGAARENNIEWVGSSDLVALVPESAQQRAHQVLRRHVNHLVARGLVEIGSETNQGFFALWLTSAGEIFLQPELAEFGQPSVLPAVISSLENRITVLSYPQGEKDGMLFELREAIAKGVPDVIAKVLVEVSSKILSGGI